MVLTVQNRQRTRRIDLPLFRRVVSELLQQWIPRARFELGIYLVAAPEMTHVNETFLHHQGSTDVITFDYNDLSEPQLLHGELFICVDEALLQACRFRVSPQSELVRYAVHGVLHLCDYDDLAPQKRRRMKREENRLLGKLAHRFDLDALFLSKPGRPTTLRA